MKETPITAQEIRYLAEPYSDYIRAIDMRMDKAHRQELAYYDRETETLYINGPLLPKAPVWAAYFCVFHTLHYAYMYHNAAALSPAVRRSMDYRVLDKGWCMRWHKGTWRVVRVDLALDWEDVRRNMPCERAAVQEATEQAFDLLSWDLDRDKLHQLAQLYAPLRPVDEAQFDALFAAIDRAVAQQ